MGQKHSRDRLMYHYVTNGDLDGIQFLGLESHICYFAGHIREFYGPVLSDSLDLQVSSGVVWVVVVPRSPRNPPRPPKLELVIYSSARVMPASSQMMISDSISSSDHSDVLHLTNFLAWKTLGSISPPMIPSNNNWVQDSPRHHHQHYSGVNSAVSALHTTDRIPSPAPPAVSSPTPSAPPINAATSTTVVNKVSTTVAETAGQTVADEPLVCVVCWESPVEGACVPCGHVSACMSCLKTIKDNEGTCPICRADIDQVVKLYGI